MNLTKRIEVLNPAPGVYQRVEHVEWVPERPKDAAARLPSTWRDPIGKELTNAAIMRRAEEGWYGKEWQNRALARKKLRSVTSSGMAIKCGCGSEVAVRYYRFSYLPKPGYYCPKCIAVHQAERDKEKNQRARWRELMMKEFV